MISGGSNIVNRDPKFKDAYKHDFELQDDSPAIGAGNSSWLLLTTDLKGNPRGNPPTIGAFEAVAAKRKK